MAPWRSLVCANPSKKKKRKDKEITKRRKEKKQRDQGCEHASMHGRRRSGTRHTACALNRAKRPILSYQQVWAYTKHIIDTHTYVVCVYACVFVTWLSKTLVLSSQIGCPASVCVHLESSVDTTCVAQCCPFPRRPTLHRRSALSASFCMSSVNPPHASFVVLWPSDIITDAGHSDEVLAYTSATMASARAATATAASPPAARPRRATPTSGIKVPSAHTRTPTSVRLPRASCSQVDRLTVHRAEHGQGRSPRPAHRVAQPALAGGSTAQRLQAAAQRSRLQPPLA